MAAIAARIDILGFGATRSDGTLPQHFVKDPVPHALSFSRHDLPELLQIRLRLLE
jgi:hypothetical protein